MRTVLRGLRGGSGPLMAGARLPLPHSAKCNPAQVDACMKEVNINCASLSLVELEQLFCSCVLSSTSAEQCVLLFD